METKKSKKANLERSKGLFFQIGLVITLAVVFAAFEWATQVSEPEIIQYDQWESIDETNTPITRRDQPEVQKPKPLMPPEEIFIVDDELDLTDEAMFLETDSDPLDQIEEFDWSDYEKEETGEQGIFMVVEHMPKFQGQSKDAFGAYIHKNLKYPTIAAENGISGTVYVSFVISPDGSVTNVEILRGVDQSLDREALRVVKSSPKWSPGEQRGRPVSVRFTFPIKFQLER